MAFDTQITDLVGGTIDQVACDQWAADACKEIINQLPANLKAKCSTISIINATNGTTLDLDGIGDILSITRLSANSGGYYLPCREIPAMYGDLANDSTDLNYYATASDPVYYITSNTSDTVTLFVKPTTTDAQPANAYHITYPTVDVSAVSVIANFPDEAEYLVVLYVATKQLLQYQSTMSSSFNTSIGTALTAINAEIDETLPIADLINTQVDSAVAELAEAATQVDSSVDTALSAMTTAAGRVNTAVILANAEFDKSDAILDLGEADSESAVNTATAKIITEMDETQGVCDKIDADLVLAKAEIVLAKAEAAELVTFTDRSSSTFQVACDAMKTELDKVDEIINLANDEFDEVSTQVSGSKDSPITDAFNEFEKSDGLLDKGEVDSESAVNDAAAKIVIELDDTRAICDDVGTSADSAITALGNMATEIALANAEVDGVTTTLAQALVLTDSGSTDIATALDGMQTAVAKFRADGGDPALFGDESTYTTASSAMTNVKTHLDRAISYVNGDFPEADSDLVQYLKDINDHVTAEDIELAGSFMSAAQTTMNAMQADLQIAQTYITEWNTMVQTLVAEVNAFAAEAGSRFGWINAKAVAWQGKLSAAQGYMGTAGGYANQANGFNSTAQTYTSEAQTRIGLANGYVAEINVRLAQSGAKRQESQSRLAAGNAYLQEAQSTVSAGNAYLSEAQGRISQAQGYAAEVNARSGFASAKTQAIQGHISTAQSYVASAGGFGTEVQTKIAIANGYIAEVNVRLAQASAKREESGARLEAGNAFLQEAATSSQEVQAYGGEVSSRLAQVGSQTSVAQGYVAAASGYASEIQSKIAIAQGYVQEATTRLQMDTTKYQWYGDQYAKLSAEYGRGLAVLTGGGAQQQQGGGV